MVLCKKSFHQVHECLRAVHDGPWTVYELVLYIGINRYKRSFWVLCAACEQVHEVLWAVSWALKFVNYYEQLHKFMNYDYINTIHLCEQII